MCSPVSVGGEAASQRMQAFAPNAALPSIVMTDHEPEPTQQTKPKKGEPIEIPVPKKRDVMDFLEKVAKTPDPERSKGTQ